MRKPWIKILYLALGHFIISMTLAYVWLDLPDRFRDKFVILYRFLETMVSILWFPLYQMIIHSFYFNISFKKTIGLFLLAIISVSFLWAISLYSLGLIGRRFWRRQAKA